MKKIVIGFLISMLMIGSIAASSIPLRNKQINSFDDSFELSFDLKDFEYEIVSTPDGEFTKVTLGNEPFSYEIGKAKLPVIRRIVEIPQGAIPEIFVDSISWEYTSLHEMNLPNMIIPSQFSTEKIPESQNEFVIDQDYYLTNSFFPEEIAKITDTGEIRGRHFAQIEVSPIQYNPLTGELKLMSSCNVRINLANSDMTKTYEKISRYSTPSYERFFETLFENYGLYEQGIENRDPEGYLIIVYDTFFEEIQPFVTQKISKGYDVTTTKTSQIPGGPTKENIYAYIEDAYDTWTIPPAYVLLVGDVPQIPTYTGSSSYSEADLYFVTVDGTDYFPDIHIGRFTGSTEAQIDSIVEKTLYYEQGDFSSFDWIKKAAFLASTDNYQTSEGTHNYVINNFLLPNGYTCDKLYTVTYGATTQQVHDAINDGRSLVVYSGHGGPSGWGDGPPFYQSDVQSLMNEDMYPFVCSHACSTNTFADSECFGETWIRVQDKGAFAFWGASASTYWDEDDILEKAMFQSWWEDGLEWIGGMTDMALLYLYENYSGGGLTRYYFEAYNLNGDPSIRLWSDNPSEPPETPSIPNGPDTWIENVEATFSTSTTDPDGDSIYYLFDWGDGEISDWLGPFASGQSVNANHAWSELGDFEVKVMAKDTYNSQSDWSDILTITIVEDEPPTTPVITGSKIVIGGREYQFTFTATDPELHQVYYKVDWDDGEKTDWIGPYSSGETMVLGHTWNQKGTFYIKAWARDIFEKESSQATFKINVPISKTRNTHFANILTRILQSRPILGRILNLI